MRSLRSPRVKAKFAYCERRRKSKIRLTLSEGAKRLIHAMRVRRGQMLRSNRRRTIIRRGRERKSTKEQRYFRNIDLCDRSRHFKMRTRRRHLHGGYKSSSARCLRFFGGDSVGAVCVRADPLTKFYSLSVAALIYAPSIVRFSCAHFIYFEDILHRFVSRALFELLFTFYLL